MNGISFVIDRSRIWDDPGKNEDVRRRTNLISETMIPRTETRRSSSLRAVEGGGTIRRVRNRVQLSSDGLKLYLNSVEDTLGADIDGFVANLGAGA